MVNKTCRGPACTVANTILKEDSRGARLAKEHKDFKRRIDAAVRP